MKMTNRTGVVLSTVIALAGIGTLSAGPLARSASAQAAAVAPKQLPPISLDLRDAPIRQALEQLFSSAGVQFSIDNSVAGFVTLKIVDQPFDNALRVLLRSSSQPLTYTKENDVYFIKPRVIDTMAGLNTAPPDAPNALGAEDPNADNSRFEQIPLMYADAYDLNRVLGGITLLPTFVRESGGGGGGGGQGGGQGGGLGGGGFGGGGQQGGFGGGGGQQGGFGGGQGGFGGGGGGQQGGFGGGGGGFGGGGGGFGGGGGGFGGGSQGGFGGGGGGMGGGGGYGGGGGGRF